MSADIVVNGTGSHYIAMYATNYKDEHISINNIRVKFYVLWICLDN